MREKFSLRELNCTIIRIKSYNYETKVDILRKQSHSHERKDLNLRNVKITREQDDNFRE